jgi:hypothetical protein
VVLEERVQQDQRGLLEAQAVLVELGLLVLLVIRVALVGQVVRVGLA